MENPALESQNAKWDEIVQKAWKDEIFKRRLVSTPTTVLKEEGFEAPKHLEVRIAENTPSIVHLVLLANPSVQPEGTTAAVHLAAIRHPGLEAQNAKWEQIEKKAWSDENFKTRLLRDPKNVLNAEDFEVPKVVEVKIVENTSSIFNLTLPAKPSSVELSDADLLQTVGGFIYSGFAARWTNLNVLGSSTPRSY